MNSFVDILIKIFQCILDYKIISAIDQDIFRSFVSIILNKYWLKTIPNDSKREISCNNLDFY